MSSAPITGTPTRTCLECGERQLVTAFPFVGKGNGPKCPRRDVCRRCTRAANVKRYNDAQAEGRSVGPKRMKENDDYTWTPNPPDIIEIGLMEIALRDGGEYTDDEWCAMLEGAARNEKQRQATGLLERIER